MSSKFQVNKSYQYTNRFDLERFVEFTHNYYDILNSPMLEGIKKLPTIGQYTIVEYPYRPDVQSYNIYKESQYWPYLMIYNGLGNVENLSLGKVLKVFSLSDLEKILYNSSNLNRKLTK